MCVTHVRKHTHTHTQTHPPTQPLTCAVILSALAEACLATSSASAARDCVCVVCVCVCERKCEVQYSAWSSRGERQYVPQGRAASRQRVAGGGVLQTASTNARTHRRTDAQMRAHVLVRRASPARQSPVWTSRLPARPGRVVLTPRACPARTGADLGVCVCVRACARACVRVCVCVCARVCVRVYRVYM